MKKIKCMFLVTVFLVPCAHAMFFINIFLKKTKNDIEHYLHVPEDIPTSKGKNSSFIKKNKNNEKLMRMHDFSDFSFSKITIYDGLLSFLSEGKKMASIDFLDDFNDLPESDKETYFNKKLVQYGHVNEKVFGIVLHAEKEENENVFEIFSCGPKYCEKLWNEYSKKYEHNDWTAVINKLFVTEKLPDKSEVEFEFWRISFKKS